MSDFCFPKTNVSGSATRGKMGHAAIMRHFALAVLLLMGWTAASCGDATSLAPDETEVLMENAPWILPARPGALERSKESTDKALIQARAEVIEAGNRALEMKPVSVTQKAETLSFRPAVLALPPADIHDFVSYRIYVWPDPTKKNGLPFKGIDGQRNRDLVSWGDPLRLRALETALNALTLSYLFSGREVYAEHAMLLLRTWFLDPATRMNPSLLYAERVPGGALGGAQGIVNTRYFSAAPDWLRILARSPALDAGTAQGLKHWFADYLDWLTTHPYGLQEKTRLNNHGAWYYQQVVGLALASDRTDWARATCLTAKTERIAKVIGNDGSFPTEMHRLDSLFYTEFHLHALYSLAALCERVDVDLWHFETPDGRGLAAGTRYLERFLLKGETWTLSEVLPRKKLVEIYGTMRRQADGVFSTGETDKSER